MNYSAFNAEWAGYALMEQSPRPVPEFGSQLVPTQQRWLARQAGKMFMSFQAWLTTLGAHLKPAPEIALIDRDEVTN